MGMQAKNEDFVGDVSASFLATGNPSMSARRARGWMTPIEAAFYCGCGVNLMRDLIRSGEVISVPSVSSRMSHRTSNDPNRRVVSVDSLDLYMATNW